MKKNQFLLHSLEVCAFENVRVKSFSLVEWERKFVRLVVFKVLSQLRMYTRPSIYVAYTVGSSRAVKWSRRWKVVRPCLQTVKSCGVRQPERGNRGGCKSPAAPRVLRPTHSRDVSVCCPVPRRGAPRCKPFAQVTCRVSLLAPNSKAPTPAWTPVTSVFGSMRTATRGFVAILFELWLVKLTTRVKVDTKSEG